MFTPRWSTVTLLVIAALAMTMGFYGGMLHRHAATPTISASEVKAPVSRDANDGLFSGNATHASDLAQTAAITTGAETDVLRLLRQAATPERNAALLAALTQLASVNPQRALALAQTEANPLLRRQLLDAVFTGWGKSDGRAAAAWILAQPEGALDANDAIAAVLKGAVQNPDTAVSLTEWLNQSNPSQARDYGDALIYALGQNGNFQRAADFAANADGEHRTEWLAAAYGNWANYQPQNAAASAQQISDAGARAAAVDAVIPMWQQSDPRGLADFAMNQLSDGDQKTRALTAALASWAMNNTVEAANWINQFGPSAEFDQSEAAIATQQQTMQQPDLALSWAQIITDPNLRSRTISAIVETWNLSDPAAALNFTQNSTDLLPDDRASLLSHLAAR